MISIITATYNSATTIRSTIESLLNQSFADWQHIIVDGASKDNTLEIIEEYRKEYGDRLIILSERDKGLYDAMNKGLKLATGEIVGILNSDDFYTSNDILEKVNQAFERNPSLDAVYGDIHFVAPDDLTKPVRYYSSASFKRSRMTMGFMPAHPSFYCRRELFEKYGDFDIGFRIAADFELLFRFIYVNNINIKYLPLDFVTMRTGGASTSGLKAIRQSQREHLAAYKKNGIKSNMFLDSLRYPIKLLEFFKK